jgi:hypothetical protein
MSLVNRLEPAARAYMERLIREGGKPLPQLSVEAARQYMRDGQSTPLEHVSISIETVDAAGVLLTIVRRAQAMCCVTMANCMHIDLPRLVSQ